MQEPLQDWSCQLIMQACCDRIPACWRHNTSSRSVRQLSTSVSIPRSTAAFLELCTSAFARCDQAMITHPHCSQLNWAFLINPYHASFMLHFSSDFGPMSSLFLGPFPDPSMKIEVAPQIAWYWGSPPDRQIDGAGRLSRSPNKSDLGGGVRLRLKMGCLVRNPPLSILSYVSHADLAFLSGLERINKRNSGRLVKASKAVSLLPTPLTTPFHWPSEQHPAPPVPSASEALTHTAGRSWMMAYSCNDNWDTLHPDWPAWACTPLLQRPARPGPLSRRSAGSGRAPAGGGFSSRRKPTFGWRTRHLLQLITSHLPSLCEDMMAEFMDFPDGSWENRVCPTTSPPIRSTARTPRQEHQHTSPPPKPPKRTLHHRTQDSSTSKTP